MKNIMFVHGMFLNPKSWEQWQEYFSARGYHCVAPAWPFHEGEPAALRANVSAGLGTLHLQTVIESVAQAAAAYDDLTLVGHSVGGLIVQILAARGIGSAAVPICSVAPNRMLALDWGFFRNSAAITNPLKGDEPFPMDAEGFYKNFGNTMSEVESNAAFERFAVPDSRNVFRDCMTDVGKIDVEQPHVPFLFIGAEKDEIVPSHLCERNAAAYTDKGSRSDFMEFTERGHFICGQLRWEEVASYIAQWLDETAAVPVTRAELVPE